MNIEFKNHLLELVEDFAQADGAFSDNTLLEVNPKTLSLNIVEEESNPDYDYYDIMDFIAINPHNPGEWLPDLNAIEEVADEY